MHLISLQTRRALLALTVFSCAHEVALAGELDPSTSTACPTVSEVRQQCLARHPMGVVDDAYARTLEVARKRASNSNDATQTYRALLREHKERQTYLGMDASGTGAHLFAVLARSLQHSMETTNDLLEQAPAVGRMASLIRALQGIATDVLRSTIWGESERVDDVAAEIAKSTAEWARKTRRKQTSSVLGVVSILKNNLDYASDLKEMSAEHKSLHAENEKQLAKLRSRIQASERAFRRTQSEIQSIRMAKIRIKTRIKNYCRDLAETKVQSCFASEEELIENMNSVAEEGDRLGQEIDSIQREQNQMMRDVYERNLDERRREARREKLIQRRRQEELQRRRQEQANREHLSREEAAVGRRGSDEYEPAGASGNWGDSGAESDGMLGSGTEQREELDAGERLDPWCDVAGGCN